MARPSPGQLRMQRRVEALIRLAAPALDLMLGAGERISRVVARDDPEYLPPRTSTPPR
jgi:hypothetical protein